MSVHLISEYKTEMGFNNGEDLLRTQAALCCYVLLLFVKAFLLPKVNPNLLGLGRCLPIASQGRKCSTQKDDLANGHILQQLD